LGGPLGNYGENEDGGIMTLEMYVAPPGSKEKIWCDDNNRFEIYFDVNGVVVGHHKRAGYDQQFFLPREGRLASAWRTVRRFFGF
jgi:hypothetical protein